MKALISTYELGKASSKPSSAILFVVTFGHTKSDYHSDALFRDDVKIPYKG